MPLCLPPPPLLPFPSLGAALPSLALLLQAKLAYSLALKSNDILQILDSVQRIKCKPAFPIIKPETLPILKGMLA